MTHSCARRNSTDPNTSSSFTKPRTTIGGLVLQDFFVMSANLNRAPFPFPNNLFASSTRRFQPSTHSRYYSPTVVASCFLYPFAGTRQRHYSTPTTFYSSCLLYLAVTRNCNILNHAFLRHSPKL